MESLNCMNGLEIHLAGKTEELRHQDYRGKRIHLMITDESDYGIVCKIDIGVHKHMEIEQEEYCFNVTCSKDGVKLLINTKEQMFTEKLRSLLKFGRNSTRYKDIYDMCWLTDFLDMSKLHACFETLIFSDDGMKENDKSDVLRRMKQAFSDPGYMRRLSASRTNWLDINGDQACGKIISFLESIPWEN